MPNITVILDRSGKTLYESMLPAELAVVAAVHQGVNRERADLAGANLTGMILGGGHLAGADFRGADLSASDCRYADSRGCDRRGTRLDETCIGGARFTGALLDGPLGISGAIVREKLPQKKRPAPGAFDRQAASVCCGSGR